MAAPSLYKVCPLCGGELERHVGVIEVPLMSPWRDGTPIPPLKKLGAFVLCSACEFGEEIT